MFIFKIDEISQYIKLDNSVTYEYKGINKLLKIYKPITSDTTSDFYRSSLFLPFIFFFGCFW